MASYDPLLPDSLRDTERQIIRDDLYKIERGTSWFIFQLYVPVGKSCFDAAIDRGHWLHENLPRRWTVDVYTWNSEYHTANIVYYKALDQKFHVWVVDGYGFPITDYNVNYLCGLDSPPGQTIMGGSYKRHFADDPLVKGIFPARCGVPLPPKPAEVRERVPRPARR